MMLVKYGGLTQRGAAKELGIASGGTVGYSAKRVQALALKERKVAKLLAGIEAELGLKTPESNGK